MIKVDKPLEKGLDGEYHCPQCEGIIKPRPRTMYWRGVYFAGLYCGQCNSIYDNPEDSFFEGVQKSVGRA